MKRKMYVFLGITAILVRNTIADQLNFNLNIEEEIENEYDLYYR